MSIVELDPIAWSAVALLVVSATSRYCLRGYPRLQFLLQVAIFSILTFLLRADDIVPYSGAPSPSEPLPRHVVVDALEIAWWLVGAWLARGFLRAFVVLGRKPSEATLIQELLGALVFLAAIIAIFAYVLDWPIKGLLATSGALAIIIGLALQSSLGDAFSGIVLNLERPYRVGDWIIVDSSIQGNVIETNWRATHIRTPSNDMAIVPNSIIAKSRIVNCSVQGQVHNASVCVRLDRSLAPDAASDLLKDVLLGSARLGHVAEASVILRDISAESLDYELGFSVPDITLVDKAKADILRRTYYATSVAGCGLASRSSIAASTRESIPGANQSRILEAIPLLDTLTSMERSSLLERKSRRVYQAGEIIARSGTVMQVLAIVGRGVSIVWEGEGELAVEGMRLTPGFYFGEVGLLTGEPLSGDVTALTQVVMYEIGKDALAPIIKARPAFADELSETLELHQQVRRTALNRHSQLPSLSPTIAGRLADTIRHLFTLH